MDKKIGNSYDYRTLRQIINANHDRFSSLNFDDSMSLLQKMNALVEFFKVMLQEYEDWITYLDEFQDKFDENLYTTVDDILTKWVDDGILTKIVNEVFAEQNKKINDFIAVTTDEMGRKVDKNGVAQINWANIGQDVREKIGNGGGTPAIEKDSVIGFEHIVNASIVNSDLKNNTIEEGKTKFIEIGSNLYDLNAVQKGGYVNYSTGVWTPDERFDTSDYVFAPPSTQITSKHTRWLLFYDNNKTFVSGVVADSVSDKTHTFTMPDNCFYFRVATQSIYRTTQQFNKGATLLPFENFKRKIKDLEITVNSLTDIDDDSIIPEKTTFIKVGKNKLNLYTATKGYYVNPTTGKLDPNQSYIASENILFLDTITLQNIRFYAIYDSNGNYITGESITSTKTIEKAAGYSSIRVSPTSGSEGVAQVEYGSQATAIEPYSAILQGIETPSSVKTSPTILLPKKLYATIGEEFKLFKQNIIKYKEGEYNFRWGRGIQGLLNYSETFNAKATVSLPIEIYSKETLVSSKACSINVNPKRTTNIKALLLGDSTVNSLTTEPPSEARLGWHMLQEMGENLTLIGTRGIGNSRHEGRGGWTAKDYRSDKTDVTGTNPFYSPTTKDFDFGYYISSTGVDVPNVVFIQLGINDIFNYTNDDTTQTKANEFVSDITFIKNNILAYNSAIKVVLNVAIPPTEKIDVFATTYSNYNLPQWRYKYNNSILNKTCLEAFEDSTTIALVAINGVIDVYNNIRDGVHPTDDGYKQIALQLCAYLNSLV